MSERDEWVLAACALAAALVVWLAGGARPESAGDTEPLPEWALAPPSRAELPPAPAAWLPFDEARFTRHGRAFGRKYVTRSLAGQSAISGFEERLLDSFHGGDDSTGWLISEPFTTATTVRGRVGGGNDCARVFVGVLQNGTVSQRFCGQNTEVLREFMLVVPAGGQLVIADFAKGGWAHVLVSDLAVAQ